MIAALRTPSRRISVAIAISAMTHIVILLLPYLNLPHAKVNLPPLTVRLEPLPHPIEKSATKPQQPIPMTQLGNGPSTKNTLGTANVMKEMEKSALNRPFPKRLQLTFAVFNGADFFRVGELLHQLEIDKDRYILKAIKQTDGPTRSKNKDKLIQISQGTIDVHGLQPESFEEEKITGNYTQKLSASFDQTAHQLNFSRGGSASLPADAQDILSFMYQLSQLSIPSMHMEFFPIPISNGTQLEQTRIEIGITEDISTNMGTMRTLHLQKMHNQGEAYFEIWLGLEYRMLPVKFRQVDGSDKVIAESVISDIRAADEP